MATEMLKSLGGEILSVTTGYACCRLPIDKVKQPMGIYHAGALLTIADEMASTAINGSEDFSGEDVPVCITLSCSFFKNDTRGPIEARAMVSHRGKTIIHVDTNIFTAAGGLMTTVRTCHIMLKKRPEA